MKLIIAGGRNNIIKPCGFRELDRIHKQYRISEVVSGTAKGIDLCGEDWARENNIAVKRFKPDWSKLDSPGAVVKQGQYGLYNSKAGIDRNRLMAEYADALAIFKGGDGSANMLETAIELNLRIFNLQSALFVGKRK